MAMLWIETKTDKEAQDLQAAIWDPVVTVEPDGTMTGRSPGPVEPDGEFWYETLQREKGDPAQRYDIARRHLPLPAAWREMAIALRAMIRQARKDKADFEPQVRELHRLAAIWSFSDPAPSGRAGRGYGVIEKTPYGKLAALNLAWDNVGCDDLSLLNQTDRKLMRELWGDPDPRRCLDLVGSGRYQRGRKPRIGAVLAFSRSARLPLGHVAVVSRIVDRRVLMVTHANWSRRNGARGHAEQDVTLFDVSERGDWSLVKVWYRDANGLGSSIYPAHGFIYGTPDPAAGKSVPPARASSELSGSQPDYVGSLIDAYAR